MKTMYAKVDTTNFPMVNVAFTGEKANDTNFALYLKELKEIYTEKEKIGIVFDARKAIIPGIAFQKMQATWLKENNQLMKDYCVGTAYVISNTIIRNVLKAIFAFQEQPVPYLVCSTLEEAEKWIENQFEN